MTPPEVLTGNTGYDRDIGFLAALMGNATDANGDPNGLFTNFFQVPLQNLFNGYTFQAGRRAHRRHRNRQPRRPGQ